MKLALAFCLLLLVAACNKKEEKEAIAPTAQSESEIRDMISSLHASLTKAYNGGGVNTDSLMDAYYDRDIYYVTPWGWTEPLDTTKTRLRRALPRIKDYDNRVENLEVKAYGEGAYASFILRQNYAVDGNPLEEYLPTTFILEKREQRWKIVRVHRSTDFETFQQYVALQQKREGTK